MATEACSQVKVLGIRKDAAEWDKDDDDEMGVKIVIDGSSSCMFSIKRN